MKDKKIELQGAFYHNNLTILVYEDSMYGAIEKLQPINNFTLNVYFYPCSHWKNYSYQSDMSAIKPKLHFRLLYVHLFVDVFVFQDKDLNVHYLRNNEFKFVLKAHYGFTFLRFNDELENFYGLSFFTKEEKVFAFSHSKGMYWVI